MSIRAIVLAAGLSKRMGDTNKLTLPINGKPMLRHTLETLSNCSLQRLYVVVGHESSELVPVLDGLDVEVVHNPKYAEGQMTSVHAGLQAIPNDGSSVMVCLSDQVLLESVDIDYLIEQYNQTNKLRILIPTFNGKRGNPIIIPRQLVDYITSQSNNLGCRNLVKNHPDTTQICPMSNDHVLVDVDTPDEYQRVRERSEIFYS